MCDKLDKLLDFCIKTKKDYDNPCFYETDEYYNDCQSRSKMLDDVISEIKYIQKSDMEKDY